MLDLARPAREKHRPRPGAHRPDGINAGASYRARLPGSDRTVMTTLPFLRPVST
jgi:hypothetical protein